VKSAVVNVKAEEPFEPAAPSTPAIPSSPGVDTTSGRAQGSQQELGELMLNQSFISAEIQVFLVG
jgi:hypothetical protein